MKYILTQILNGSKSGNCHSDFKIQTELYSLNVFKSFIGFFISSIRFVRFSKILSFKLLIKD